MDLDFAHQSGRTTAQTRGGLGLLAMSSAGQHNVSSRTIRPHAGSVTFPDTAGVSSMTLEDDGPDKRRWITACGAGSFGHQRKRPDRAASRDFIRRITSGKDAAESGRNGHILATV